MPSLSQHCADCRLGTCSWKYPGWTGTVVPEGFRFGIKLPDALTLTHYRPKSKAEVLVPNPHFLSLDLLHAVLYRLEPMRGKLGPMMLQVGYLNRHMAPSQATFLEQLGAFAAQLPKGYESALLTGMPNALLAPATAHGSPNDVDGSGDLP